MKGLVRVTPDSLCDTIDKIHVVMESFDISRYSEKKMIWSWRKFKKVEWTCYSGLPFWYQYRNGLIEHLQELKDMENKARQFGDEIWISELSYCHLVKMSNGDKYANPIYIMNY